MIVHSLHFGHIFWLCGLSGAGKSTLAALLMTALRARGISVLGLDGDAMRAGVSRSLGFTAEDRMENLRRAACVGKIAQESGLCTVASFITPLEEHRKCVRETVGPENISLIYMDASYAVCQRRDVKGLYARAANGKVEHFTGLSDPFEPPADADLILHTGAESAEESAAKLLEFVLARLESTRVQDPPLQTQSG